jgi:hypothetical protein
MRPQAKAGSPAPVVKHAFDPPKPFDCAPDLALRCLVVVSQGANNGLFCSKEIVIEQIQDAYRLKDLGLKGLLGCV